VFNYFIQSLYTRIFGVLDAVGLHQYEYQLEINCNFTFGQLFSEILKRDIITWAGPGGRSV